LSWGPHQGATLPTLEWLCPWSELADCILSHAACNACTHNTPCSGKCVRRGSVSSSSVVNLNSGADPVATCRSHCNGRDYFGMEWPGQSEAGGFYCMCLSTSEYDNAPQLPMFHCLGECQKPPNGQTSTCTGRNLHGLAIDDNCPGILINGQRHHQWNGYALGASWRTAIYSVS